MSVANLYNVPTDLEGRNVWTFSNADSHTQIILAIQRLHQISLVPYVLDPLPTEDFATFLQRHQAMHVDMSNVTKIATNNYTGIDWNDPSTLTYYLQLHAAEHVATHTALGI